MEERLRTPYHIIGISEATISKEVADLHDYGFDELRIYKEGVWYGTNEASSTVNDE